MEDDAAAIGILNNKENIPPPPDAAAIGILNNKENIPPPPVPTPAATAKPRPSSKKKLYNGKMRLRRKPLALQYLQRFTSISSSDHQRNTKSKFQEKKSNRGSGGGGGSSKPAEAAPTNSKSLRMDFR
ncbi:unnamed protein product [Malus baccata var. baccata]